MRVRVASLTRSADLALHPTLPLAELVPELARSVGLLDASRAPAGYAVLAEDGHPLSDEAGLLAQGVRDGALLGVVALADEELARRYDDPAEAMADAVERGVSAWPPVAGRLAGHGAATALLALAAAALWLPRGDPVAARAAAAFAATLLAVAVALSRGLGAPDGPPVLAWAAAGHAAVAGGQWASAGSGGGADVLAAAGTGALGASLAAMVGLASGRVSLLPAALLSLTALAVGSLLARTPAGAGSVAAGLLVGGVLLGGLTPRLALSVAGLGGPAPPGVAGQAAEVDPAAAEADALLAHRVVVALEGTLGVLLVLAAPAVAGLGPAGGALALCCCGATMLRARHVRAAALVLTTLGCGALATVATLGTLLALHPHGRGVLSLALVAAALVLVAAPAARAGGAGGGWHRVADVAGSCCHVALLPLLLVVTGALDRVAASLAAIAG